VDTSTKELNIPTVSILMLTYNRAHFIGEAISSVVNQTYKNWDLIIIDDGSTDNTASVVSKFSDPRINYVSHKENAGLFARRAESLLYAKGTYTAILDSDDLWTNVSKLEEQVKFLEENVEYVLVGTQTRIIDFEGNTIKKYSHKTSDEEIRNSILARNQFTHSAVLIRTEALQKTSGYQPTLAEDLDLFLQLGKFGKFANLNKFYTAHRVHNQSENDHGVKMATAVHNIIKNYSEHYPKSLQAKIISRLRLLKSQIK
jgi:GT2 family glycosyltransferase